MRITQPVFAAPVFGGESMKPTPVSIDEGELWRIKKDDSTSKFPLKRDIWMVRDVKTGRSYSVFHPDPARMDAIYRQLAQWGEGAEVIARGVAQKPSPRQRYPFLAVSAIELNS